MSRVLPSGACVLEHRTGQHTAPWKTNTVAAGRSQCPWVRSGGVRELVGWPHSVPGLQYAGWIWVTKMVKEGHVQGHHKIFVL